MQEFRSDQIRLYAVQFSAIDIVLSVSGWDPGEEI